MNCPYCNTAMRYGGLNSVGVRAVYWVPKSPYGDYSSPANMLSLKKDVESRGGIILGDVNHVFEKKSEPVTWYCKACNLLITKLD